MPEEESNPGPTDNELIPPRGEYSLWNAHARAFLQATADVNADAKAYRIPSGDWKMRPIEATDGLGRSLVFTYDNEPLVGGQPNPTYGLLEKVETSDGAGVHFSYNRPTAHPTQLNESFLTQANRELNPTLDHGNGAVPTYTYEYQ